MFIQMFEKINRTKLVLMPVMFPCNVTISHVCRKRNLFFTGALGCDKGKLLS